MQNNPHIISITNQVGGVGKSTAAENLAIGLSLKGKRILVIDADPQADSSEFFLPESDDFNRVYIPIYSI